MARPILARSQGEFINEGRAWWHAGLMCAVQSLSYDFESKHGRLILPPGNCTDMDGCIEVFLRIDALVQLIAVQEGTDSLTIYGKVDGQWQARLFEYQLPESA